MDDQGRRNIVVGVALSWAVGLLITFFVALLGSRAGEIAAAVGGVIGGIVGAGGAVYGVFLTLDRQRKNEAATRERERKDETDKVADAIRAEIVGMVRYVIGAVRNCEDVVGRRKHIPQSDARYLVNKLPAPIIYPAVADKIALLPQVHATIEFYMRIMEGKAMAEALALALAEPGALIRSDHVTPIADSLLIALVASLPIISERGRIAHTMSSEIVRERVLHQVLAYLQTVHTWLPEAKVLREPRAF
jgi:hypothetical protein